MNHVRLQSLTLAGFGVFRETAHLRLDRPGLYLVTGENRDTTAAKSNGSGKSTVFKGITWALYGRTIDGLTTNVVHKTARAACAELVFVVGDNTYLIRRSRSASKGALELRCTSPDPKDLTAASVRATQDAIEGLIGVDYDGFRMCCLFGQGDVARFAAPGMTDAGRKEVLRAILRLDRYANARDFARAKVEKIAASIRDWQRRREEYERAIELNARKISRLTGELDALVIVRDQGADVVKDQLAIAAEHEIKLAEALQAESQLEEEVKALDAELDEINGLARRAHSISDGLLRDLRAAEKEAKRLATFEDDPTCSKCGQEVPFDPAELQAATQAVSKIDDELGKAKRRNQKWQEVTREAMAARQETLAELSDARADVVRLRSAITAAKKAADSAADSLADCHTRIDKLRIAIQDHVEENEVNQEHIGVADAEIEALTVSERVAQWWVSKGFGPKGVPAYAIEQTLPALNAGTNEHLATLADGDIEVVWTATTPGASGNVKEELTCNVVVEGIEGAIPSGGQLRKIELATELALAEIVGASGVSSFNALFFDEALDGLDEPGRRRVVDWLQSLPYATIFVVSHTDEIADAFEQELRVCKDGGAATIEAI